MKIFRRSPLTLKMNVLDLPITQEQIDAYLIGGALIQEVFPNLTPDEREFLMTGYTKEDWDAIFKGSEE